jgi:hypothetical protein
VRVVFATARSSPGVTTAAVACAAAWPEPVLLVEASEDGGAVAARFGLGLEPGLTTLVAALRHDRDAELDRHLQTVPGTSGRVRALVGPPACEPAVGLLRAAAGRVAVLLDAQADGPVLVDAGRLPPVPLTGPLLAGADRLVLVCRPRVEELQALAHRLPKLRAATREVGVLLVGDRPYGPEEVVETLQVEVVGVVAHDPPAADALCGVAPPRRLGRSALLRSAVRVVAALDPDAAPHPAVATRAEPPLPAPTQPETAGPVRVEVAADG